MTYIIQTHQLTKRFAADLVIDHVTMKIKEGEIYGFLGPNGAGKTTIMKMLLNLVKPSSGDIFIQGNPVNLMSYHYLQDIGSLIEYPIFYEDLTAYENLQIHCTYVGQQDDSHIVSVLDTVGLRNIDRKKVKEFSLGMRQRLAIARAIVTKPKILILDEPINGLDPIGIKEVRELLVLLKRQYGMTILISSHIISEIESIADTIGVIDDGKLIEEISMSALRKRNQPTIKMVVSNVQEAKRLLEGFDHTQAKIIDEKTVHVTKTRETTAVLTKRLIFQGVDVEEVVTFHETLEEYFVNRINGGKEHVAIT
ncbi:putative ABC transporter ATP-binding protein YcbN [Sporosarcina sp. NCCP-2222]|uniref:ABC transporter ATP-binding protein n=1 Tax=Sporosarcina sp. NCCP-2222 TaxID=2935073 RepID=UPI002085A305|nr:ABC transporter ATP-binding protein [Sporosarcina sp. NCCP-2222]GKV56949.1 putative ABC transporter ATP-binding protein YcbN [Sporosarcina sp. NCCP-2222]